MRKRALEVYTGKKISDVGSDSGGGLFCSKKVATNYWVMMKMICRAFAK